MAAGGLTLAIACASNVPESDDDDDDRHDRRRSHAASPETLAKGRTIYMATCAPCHGNEGKGDGPASKIFKPPPRDHTDATYMDTIKDDDMARTIQMGGALKGKPLMPSHPAIRGDDMKALVAYVRSLSQRPQ